MVRTVSKGRSRGGDSTPDGGVAEQAENPLSKPRLAGGVSRRLCVLPTEYTERMTRQAADSASCWLWDLAGGGPLE
jgi:hypothetical protein